MVRRVVAATAGGALIALAGIGGAEAYFADSEEFQLRGGAAALAVQIELGPVERAIRDQLAATTAETERAQHDLAGVIAYYQARGYRPVWIEDGLLNDRARAAIARIEAAAGDGLNPANYPTPEAAGVGALARSLIWPGSTESFADGIATDEIQLSLAVATYVREAYSGQLDPRSIAYDIDVDPVFPETATALRSVATADDVAAALDAFNPTHAGYLALRDELARIRAGEAKQAVIVPVGPSLRLGDEDDRVAILRTRLDVAVPEDGVETLFDEVLDEAVRAFQAGSGLVADGIVGPNTLTALNGPDVNPEGEIIANMERWRWAPREFGDYYVNVNVPEYAVRIIDNGSVTHETRVVVGQRANRTPIFSDEIEHLIVNPYWYVPASIVANEMMPILRSDPGYFVRNNFDVFARWNGSVSQVNPYQVDWSQLSANQVSMRQRPGGGNALGRIKFMFPNQHAVYLHDTPSKSLFSRDVRAFSHGCVRVQDPMAFADALLARSPDWNASRLEGLFGNQERQINLDAHIPVHLTYFTAIVGENGEIQFKNDIYGHSAVVRSRLGLEG